MCRSATRPFAPQALQQGRIDATTMSIGVFLAMPERADLGILVDLDDFHKATPIVSKVNVVTENSAGRTEHRP